MERVQEDGGLAGYMIIGTDHPTSHHTPTFDVDERSLEHGVDVSRRVDTGTRAPSPGPAAQRRPVSERPESGRPESDPAVTLADVEAARERLAGVVHRTPLDTSRTFAELSGAASSGTQAGERPADGVVQDPRGVQRDAGFSQEQQDRGVVTASAGNHAQGVALAGTCWVST